MPAEQRQQRHPIRIELVAYYYDPSWRLLWGECNGAYSYWPVTGMPLPLRSGQRVRIEGTVIPAQGIENVKVTVLKDQAMPEPLPTRGALDDVAKFDARWATLEGYIIRQAEADPTHLELGVLSDGRVITMRVQLGPTDPIPQLLNAHVRIAFVYVPARDAAGVVSHIDGWVPRRSDINVLGWIETEPLFNRPTTPIEFIASSAPDTWLHIAGEIRAYDANRSITVRDATGEIVIRTEQPVNFEAGDMVEVIGRPVVHGADVTLAEPCCRIVPRGTHSAGAVASGRVEPLLKLRLAEQVMELRPDEASQHLSAYLQGVVTWSDPKAPFFFLEDRSGGIRVRTEGASISAPPFGTMVSVTGTTAAGTFAPEVELQRLTIRAKVQVAPPHLITLDEALAGAEESQRIEMRGYLRSVEPVGTWLQLNLTAANGEFTASMAANPAVESLVGSIVRVTGVCTAVTNAQREITSIRLWVTDPGSIEVERARPVDPFAAASRSIAGLRQVLAVRPVESPVRLNGVVVYDRPGTSLYLQEGDAGLLVLRRDTTPVAVGQAVEVVGLPGRDGPRLVLREAVLRQVSAREIPPPLNLGNGAVLEPRADGRLARIRGRLVDQTEDANAHRFILRTGATAFVARIQKTAALVPPRDGSVLDVTGVYVLEFDEYRRPRAFHIELRSSDDIRVVEAASWWTASRALAIAGGFAFTLVLAAGWVMALRRRVRRQTAQIRAQLEKQARLDAELERAARLESLGVLAGGIAHDFNNLLTVIIANLGLAAMDDRVQAAAGDTIAEAERGARRAADLTQQLLTFAKGGDPVRRAVALPDVVRESAEFARHGSGVRCVYEVERDLPPAEVDRGQISRVVHNLVLNATQAMPEGGVIRIGLAAVTIGPDETPNLKPGRYVKLSVSDEGRGIAPEHLARIFEPYFSTKPKNNGLGLATVHSIVKKHLGHISVRSELGHGTTFDVWLPVASEVPVAHVQPCVAPCATTPLRVLFMDDDEIIRRTADSLLRQLGHDAKIVGDGMDVVREYEAALNSGMRYDVVVLDLTVPGGLGGRAAMEILRRIDPGVRGIVSSGYSNDPVLANYRSYGFSAVVPKPYVVDDLARAIQQVAAMKVGPTLQASAPLAI